MVASAVATAASAAGSKQALVLGSAEDPNAVGMVLVKFFFKDPDLIPAGISRVDRQPSYQLDVARQLEAFKAGQKALAISGRVRKGRVDTGEQVIKFNRPVHAAVLRRGLANNGYRLTHLHWFSIDPDPAKDTKGQAEPMYVVCACLVRQLQNSEPSSAHVDALRALSNLAWNTLFVWENPPGNPATINFRGLAKGQKPKAALVVRDGSVIVEEVADVLPESQE